MELAIALSAVLGLVIGSFLNVVIYRVPAKLSIVSPPSACPACGSAIRRVDNIPLLSWLLLRGRCRNCAERISIRYPLVEAGTAVAFVAVTVFVLSGWHPVLATLAPLPLAFALVALLYLVAVTIALSLIDLDTMTLPNAIVLPSLIVGFVLLGIASLLAGDPGQLGRAAIGAAALFVFYLVMAIAYPGGMGFGDVKLAPVLGLQLAWVGWGEFAVGAFAPFVLGGLFAFGLLILRRGGPKSRIPFGPWMLVGSWVGIFYGGAISMGYLRLFGIA
jgi:leader peptidase (prepilin peptidase)/N-methyltransferase